MDAHMKFDADRIINALLLRPRRKTEEEKRFGTFDRRMLAAGLDLLLLTVLVAPVVDHFFYKHYGPPPVAFHELAARISTDADSPGAMKQLWREMESSGFLEHFTQNLRWQLYVLVAYAAIFWHFFGATPGKLLCHLRVVDAKTGKNARGMQALLRALSYIISGAVFGLGFLWVGLNKKKRGWHDLIADTLVVTVPWPWQKKKATEPEPQDRTPSH